MVTKERRKFPPGTRGDEVPPPDEREPHRNRPEGLAQEAVVRRHHR